MASTSSRRLFVSTNLGTSLLVVVPGRYKIQELKGTQARWTLVQTAAPSPHVSRRHAPTTPPGALRRGGSGRPPAVLFAGEIERLHVLVHPSHGELRIKNVSVLAEGAASPSGKATYFAVPDVYTIDGAHAALVSKPPSWPALQARRPARPSVRCGKRPPSVAALQTPCPRPPPKSWWSAGAWRPRAPASRG